MVSKNISRMAGQTIVEAIVVIGIVVILVTGLIAGTTSSLKSVQTGRTRSQAVKYAQEGIEFVRMIRNESWDTFVSYNNNAYCVGTDRQFVARAGENCPNNIATPDSTFSRTILFSGNPNGIEVTVSIRFVEGSGYKTVQLVTVLTNWR